jgi:alpha-galactosidase
LCSLFTGFLAASTTPTVVDRLTDDWFVDYGEGKDMCRCALLMISVRNADMGVDAFSFERAITNSDSRYAAMHAQAVRTASLDESFFARAEGEYEQLIDILASLWEDRQRIFSVNLPNQGVVQGLPAEAILALPAAATGRGFLPTHVPARPPALIAPIAWRVAAHALTVEAGLIGNCTLWCEALLADGAVTDPLLAEQLVAEMLAAHRPRLPHFA